MLLGVLLVVLGKLNKVFPKPEFTWSIFMKNNLISVLMNVVAGVFLVLNQTDLLGIFTKIFPDNAFFAGGLFAGVCGIAGVTIVQFLVDLTNPNKKTVIGI